MAGSEIDDVVSPDEEDMELERVVFQEILSLQPLQLTRGELILKIATARGDRDGVYRAIRELKASGVIRYVDGVIAPTHAAQCTADLLRT